MVIGASGGIGEELARVHAEQSGNLVVVARSVDKLAQLKDELETQFGVNVIVISHSMCVTTRKWQSRRSHFCAKGVSHLRQRKRAGK